uniref:IQ motif and ubiquitin domain containing n=1 Tax=Acanthochromis polyacanthus TaxID=80966 RepID=A0A3Q1G8Y6_9TELE
MTRHFVVPDELRRKYKLKWDAESLKYLGIILTKDLTKLFNANYKPLSTKIKADLHRWNFIPFLNLNSRINTIKMNILPRLLYIFRTLPVEVDDSCFKEWDKLISRFIWQEKRPRIRYNSLQSRKEKGGMALPFLKKYFSASQLIPLLHWCNSNYKAKWKELEFNQKVSFPLQAVIADKSLLKQLEECKNPWINLTWQEIVKSSEIQDMLKLFRWVAYDSDFSPNRTDETFQSWIKKGLTTYLSFSEKHILHIYHSSSTQVICLQSFTRRWLAQQAVDRLKKERQRRLTWLQMQERKRREEKEEQLRDRRQRWTNPERREDLNLLYHALEKWRREEEQQINSFLRGAERKAALCLLLEQETELIATIGRHHITFQNNNYDKIIQHLLDKAVAPHQWRAADGRLIEMDNLHTIRARELRDLYSNISLFTVSQEQRSHILMTLKHTVNEHKCLLTRDIVDLIDREVDLMKRGVQTRNLEGLRKRICTLFLQYIKTQAFNPAVSKLLKVPQNPSELNKDVLLCRSCQRYLRSTNFIAFAKGLSTRCKDCTRLDNIARPRNDFSCYQSILRRLIVAEQQLSKESKIPFLLKVEDIRYLIEVVWLSQSALNASSDLYNLMLVRWEHQKDWSPWNCILLSKEEASAHFEVEDVNKAYEMTFIHKVKHKHRLAQRYFSQISIMAEYLDSAAPPAAALSNQLLSKPITMATHRLATDPSPDSAH